MGNEWDIGWDVGQLSPEQDLPEEDEPAKYKGEATGRETGL